MLEILATTVAILRTEVKNRAAARKKDSLSKRLRRLHKVRGGRIRLDEDILAAMKEEAFLRVLYLPSEAHSSCVTGLPMAGIGIQSSDVATHRPMYSISLAI